MVAGHLQEKKGFYYIVLSYMDQHGKRKTKWQSTSLPVKGNKKRAEAMLMDARRDFEECKEAETDNILFADFLDQWLDVAKSTVELVTYSSYCNMVKGIIAPYFRKKGILQIILEYH